VNPENKEKPKVGVYVCHCGGNISDVVDVERVAKAAGELGDVEVARDYVFMCSDPGQKLIEDDIRNKGINRVIVAACSPSLHELTFRRTLIRAGSNPYLFEPVNIREQCSWCHKSTHEKATEKALSLVGAGVGKVRQLEPLDPIRVDAIGRVVVIGAGIAGLRAALDLSERGLSVVLVEKSPFIGGRTAQLHSTYPTDDEAREILHRLIDAVLKDPGITLHTCSEVVGAIGYIGDFRLTVKTISRGVTDELTEVEKAISACPEETDNEYDYNLNKRKAIYYPYKGCQPPVPAIDWETCTKCGKCADAVDGKGIVLDAESKEFEVEAGVILIATGFNHYEPRKGEYGYKEFPEVITLPQLIRLIDPEGPTGGELKVNGRKIENVAFIHCVGSREVAGIHEPHENGEINDYCSRVCCMATLQLANEITEKYPKTNIFELYQDIRSYGKGHEDYYETASENGVLFVKYVPESRPVVEPASNGGKYPLQVRVIDYLTFKEELIIPVDLIVLSVGIEPRDTSSFVEMFKLPVGVDRFLLEVHPKLRPVETAIDGVILAGSAQGPMDITESCAAASAASVKASMILGKGYVELDPFVVVVNLDRCDGTGLCVEECLYEGAIALEEMEIDGQRVKRAKVNVALCKGCGACVAV
jgi:heterodisulfide reductase subunit A